MEVAPHFLTRSTTGTGFTASGLKVTGRRGSTIDACYEDGVLSKWLTGDETGEGHLFTAAAFDVFHAPCGRCGQDALTTNPRGHRGCPLAGRRKLRPCEAALQEFIRSTEK